MTRIRTLTASHSQTGMETASPVATQTPTSTSSSTSTTTNSPEYSRTATRTVTVSISPQVTISQYLTVSGVVTTTPASTQSPSATPSPTRTATESISTTGTWTPRAVITASLTRTAIITASAQITNTHSPTVSTVATLSPTLSPSPTVSSSSSLSITATSMLTPSRTPTPSGTVSFQESMTIMGTQTGTRTLDTSTTSTETTTVQHTSTPIESVTGTPAETESPLATSTSKLTGISSYTDTPSRTTTITATPTVSPTQSSTASPTASSTPSRRLTQTGTPSASNTREPTSSRSPTSAITASSTPTDAFTDTVAITSTLSQTKTIASTPTASSSSTLSSQLSTTASGTRSATSTRNYTSTQTFTGDVSHTPTPTTTQTDTSTSTPSVSSTSRVTGTPSNSPSEVATISNSVTRTLNMTGSSVTTLTSTVSASGSLLATPTPLITTSEEATITEDSSRTATSTSSMSGTPKVTKSATVTPLESNTTSSTVTSPRTIAGDQSVIETTDTSTPSPTLTFSASSSPTRTRVMRMRPIGLKTLSFSLDSPPLQSYPLELTIQFSTPTSESVMCRLSSSPDCSDESWLSSTAVVNSKSNGLRFPLDSGSSRVFVCVATPGSEWFALSPHKATAYSTAEKDVEALAIPIPAPPEGAKQATGLLTASTVGSVSQPQNMANMQNLVAFGELSCSPSALRQVSKDNKWTVGADLLKLSSVLNKGVSISGTILFSAVAFAGVHILVACALAFAKKKRMIEAAGAALFPFVEHLVVQMVAYPLALNSVKGMDSSVELPSIIGFIVCMGLLLTYVAAITLKIKAVSRLIDSSLGDFKYPKEYRSSGKMRVYLQSIPYPRYFRFIPVEKYLWSDTDLLRTLHGCLWAEFRPNRMFFVPCTYAIQILKAIVIGLTLDDCDSKMWIITALSLLHIMLQCTWPLLSPSRNVTCLVTVVSNFVITLCAAVWSRVGAQWIPQLEKLLVICLFVNGLSSTLTGVIALVEVILELGFEKRMTFVGTNGPDKRADLQSTAVRFNQYMGDDNGEFTPSSEDELHDFALPKMTSGMDPEDAEFSIRLQMKATGYGRKALGVGLPSIGLGLTDGYFTNALGDEEIFGVGKMEDSPWWVPPDDAKDMELQ